MTINPAADREARADVTGPLAGIRVVEFVGIGPGPYAAMLLADMGAEVLRVDRPGGSDSYSRHVVPRGRRIFTADLKEEVDRKTALALLDGADALLEGFRPGVMERLGLGPDVVLARNPRLVYGRMTGWGQDGPLAMSAGHDIGYIAITGALAAIGPAEAPVPPLNLAGDYGGGALFLVTGVLAALLHAERTGTGQVVDAAICDGVASLMSMFYDLHAQGRWKDDRASNLLDGGAPFYRTYTCKGGGFIAVGALEPQFYTTLCERAGLPQSPRADPETWPALHAQFASLFAERTRDEWCVLLEGTDACAAPVLGLAEAPSHPHLRARGTFVERDGVVQPQAAPRFSVTPTSAGSVAHENQPVADACWTPRGHR